MKNWQNCLIKPDKQLIDAIRIIDTGGGKIALVADENNVLLGTITDYDIRQAILKGCSVNDSIRSILNPNPQFVSENESDFDILQKMRTSNIRQMPILNSRNEIVGLKLISELNKDYYSRTNPVLLMAGGLGSRLRSLTNKCPKPLLKVGGKPILEIILQKFIESGFNDFYISVNYKAEMIQKYFGRGEKYGVNIKYVKEEKRLGTAGALGLLPSGINEPVIVMNGDLLTKVDFHQLLDFHYRRKSTATMCVREYEYQVPYGVVNFKDWEMKELQEKPSYSFFVNAGIYVLNPEIIYQVEKDEYLDMTDLFNKNIQQKKRTLVFPIREYWMDIGRIEDFQKAQEEFI